MKIIGIQKIKCYFIETDEYDYNQYTRYGSNSWSVTMGMSEEPFYSCAKIELLFQEYIKTNNIVEKI
jgi:hypothetical protein